MLNKYYQQELQKLRDLAQEYSALNPAVAPLLSGPSADPDVERLLEGVAFLTGLLWRKIDDELPEIVHALTEIIYPHYLRPIPSMSVVQFSPKPGTMETIKVKAGTTLAANPVEGVKCNFTTCYDIEVHPLRVLSVEHLTGIGEPDRVRLVLSLQDLELEQWQPGRLSFYFGGPTQVASQLFMALAGYSSAITLAPFEGGRECRLSPEQAIRAIGFDPNNSLLPHPSQSFLGYRLFQEFFLLPQKFLYLDILGWEKWKNRGTGTRFAIEFTLKPLPVELPELKPEYFMLATTPVVNLFAHEADPITMNMTQDKVKINPAGKFVSNTPSHQVLSIDQVIGVSRGTVTKTKYSHINQFRRDSEKDRCYQVLHRLSPLHNSPEVYLSFTCSSEDLIQHDEILSISLTCSNGVLPEQLKLGDICKQTSDSPGLLDFSNILPVTAPIDPQLGSGTLWKFLSHFSLNLLPLADTQGLQELLQLYIFPESKDRGRVAACQKRVDGLEDFKVEAVDRIVRGLMMRGQEIHVTARQDHFASLGDFWLFGAVLNEFFSEYTSMNTFTQLKMKDSVSGEQFVWPARIGNRPLL